MTDRLVLANIDYETHMTDEGNQLQLGLALAGWHLAGHGYDDGERRVPELLARHQPSLVFIQDKRDWDATNMVEGAGCFNPQVHFAGLAALATYPAFTATPIKDFWFSEPYWRQLREETDLDAAVLYYNPRMALQYGPSWLRDLHLVRIYHSVDPGSCMSYTRRHRQRAIVTGACSDFYPVRSRAFAHAKQIGLDTQNHPGYHNHGAHTPFYLRRLMHYRVHLATCSRFNLALRKIIESVACGCTPVTNLPDWEVLPEIDGALLRISTDAPVSELLDAVAQADSAWDYEERLAWARKAHAFYDYRAAGVRLSEELCRLSASASTTAPASPD